MKNSLLIKLVYTYWFPHLGGNAGVRNVGGRQRGFRRGHPARVTVAGRMGVVFSWLKFCIEKINRNHLPLASQGTPRPTAQPGRLLTRTQESDKEEKWCYELFSKL